MGTSACQRLRKSPPHLRPVWCKGEPRGLLCRTKRKLFGSISRFFRNCAPNCPVVSGVIPRERHSRPTTGHLMDHATNLYAAGMSEHDPITKAELLAYYRREATRLRSEADTPRPWKCGTLG